MGSGEVAKGAAAGEEVEGIGIDDGGAEELVDDNEGVGFGGAEAGADGEGVEIFGEDLAVVVDGFDHDFGRDEGEDEGVIGGFDKESDESGPGFEGTEGAEGGGSGEAPAPGDNPDPPGLSFMEIEGAVEGGDGQSEWGDEVILVELELGEAGEGKESESAHVVSRGVGEESDFWHAESEGEVGSDGVFGGAAGVAIESGGDIDGDDVGALSVEVVDFAGESGEGFADGSGSADAEESIEKDEGSRSGGWGEVREEIDGSEFAPFFGGEALELVGWEAGTEGHGPAGFFEDAEGDHGIGPVVSRSDDGDGVGGRRKFAEDFAGDFFSGFLHEGFRFDP